ncbi:MAG: cob(I)yrinic acid a,c-diamide adenosyltransferase [Bacteroidia bacterium]|nr:cob(I)yrinic acid a,c-diamide adenosyltransferase [Bacteroidia bacterium]
MKIYTKTGDNGYTSLIDGTKVSKNHIRIEAYGTIDELISYIGLLCDLDIGEKNKMSLIIIQKKLMACASILATPKKVNSVQRLQLTHQDISFLENEIDRMNSELPSLKSFLIPGGHIAVSVCHIARSIARRAERRVVSLFRKNKNINIHILIFLNRLSDYLFILSRSLSKKFNCNEIIWNID